MIGDENKIVETTSFDKSYREYDILTQVKDMGFETFNPILNIGGLFAVIFVVVMQFMLVIVLKFAVSALKKQRQLFKTRSSDDV